MLVRRDILYDHPDSGMSMKSGLLIFTLIAVFIAIILTPTVVTDYDNKDFVIIHTGDVHGYIDGDASKGLSTVKALKEKYEAQGKTVFLVDVGDFYSESACTIIDEYYAMYPMCEVGYDIATVGNHEFDRGIDHFRDISPMLGFPMICSNLVDKEGNSMFEEYRIIEKNGIKVGFFGLISPELPKTQTISQLCGTRVIDPVEAAERMVTILKGENVDAIVLLSHLGFGNRFPITSDQLCSQVEGIDLCINGHSHTPMEHGTFIKDDFVLEDSDTWFCDSGEYLSYIGVTTRYDGTYDSLLYSGEVLSDEDVDAAVRDSYMRTETAGNVYLTTTEVDLGKYNFNRDEHGQSKLFANYYKSLSDDIEIGLVNVGMFQVSMGAGTEITVKHAFNSIPYYGDVYKFTMDGRELRYQTELMLIEGANIFCFPEYSDNVHIQWDPNRSAGDRIVSFTVNGEELDSDRTYVLCSISFVFDYYFGLPSDHIIENMGDRTQSVKDCFSSCDPITEEQIGPDRYEMIGS